MSHRNGVYCIEDTGELYGHNSKIVVMLDPQRRNNLRIERDLLIQELESETSRFQKDHIEKAFRYLKGNACLAPIGYQLQNRVEACLSVVNFIAYELIAAILWKIEKFNIGIGYEGLMEKASKIICLET